VYSVDIDVGGTLTDGIFSDGNRAVCTKVDSTPHDLTVCLFDCLSQGATQLGFSDVTTFLEQVELLRWSTTITSNVLAELRGPKIGLMVSKGHERDLYGEQQFSPVLNNVLDERNIVGIEGNGGAEVLTAVRSLLERGVRRVCISLRGSFQHPEKEQQIKRLIDDQYPDHFLGSVPVLAGSDICQNTDDMTRTYYAVINAYTHSALAATLFKAEDELRYTHGYSRAFLISHINGGVAGVSKTRAIDTMESGPILGIHGASYMAKVYGVRKVIALDVGGTTAKLGVIREGEPLYSQQSNLFAIPLRVSLPYLRSIALGGGSVVKPNDKSVELGPESMGSFPGPACYGLGGENATLTDAFVAAGLINPEHFLGGTKHLDLDLARGAIEHVARPQSVSAEEACHAVIDRAYDMVAGMIETAGNELNQDLSDHILFAYGGNGGLFACGVADRANLSGVYLFALGPVFSAFGSSVSNISHVYERSFHLPLGDGADVGPINRLIEEMRAAGMRDLLGEGIQPDQTEYSVEMELTRPGLPNVSVEVSHTHFECVRDLRESLNFDSQPGDSCLELVRVRVKKPIARAAFTQKSAPASAPASASMGKRTVVYGSTRGEADLYQWESLQPGSRLQGCCILEAESSTYFVPEGWTLEIDRYGNAQLTRGGPSAHASTSRLGESGSDGQR
jgi:N-methylhydantoinase A